MPVLVQSMLNIVTANRVPTHVASGSAYHSGGNTGQCDDSGTITSSCTTATADEGGVDDAHVALLMETYGCHARDATFILGASCGSLETAVRVFCDDEREEEADDHDDNADGSNGRIDARLATGGANGVGVVGCCFQ
jgi:hypothetical protein